jgi:hypothetical protein
MTGTRSALVHVNENVRGSVRFGDGSSVKIHGIGSMVKEGRHNEHKVLSGVYYIPKLKSNIVSLGQLEEAGCDIRMYNGCLQVFDQEKNPLISAPRTGNRLYTVKLGVVPPVCLPSKLKDEAWLWHARFGHLNFRALRELSRKDMATGVPVIDHVEQVCEGCALGKHHRAPFPKVSGFRAKKGLELFHYDLCGQITPPTLVGKNYFLLVDDYSRYMWIELLRPKDEALSCLKKVKARAEIELEGKLKGIRTDRGGEFNSNQFTVFCTEFGIKHYTTTPYTPRQNGVVERRNQTVVEMARCMLKSKGVPAQNWGEAVSTAVYMLDRSPTKSLEGITPYEALYGKKLRVEHLRVFGSVGLVKNIGPAVKKLSDRSTRMVFLGYEEGTKGYRMFDPVLGKLHVSRDVIFQEELGWEWENQGNNTQPDYFTIQHQFTVEDPATVGLVHQNLPLLEPHSQLKVLGFSKDS